MTSSENHLDDAGKDPIAGRIGPPDSAPRMPPEFVQQQIAQANRAKARQGLTRMLLQSVLSNPRMDPAEPVSKVVEGCCLIAEAFERFIATSPYLQGADLLPEPPQEDQPTDPQAQEPKGTQQ